MSKPSLKVTSDFTRAFSETIKRFKNDVVLVGIPSTDKEREEDDGITNAAILAINHFGSDNGHIRPWPVMTIGIRKAKDLISDQFKECARNVLRDGISALNTYYERAGIIASNSVKKSINDQDGVQGDRPMASTLRARKYLTKSGFKGTKLLVVTGQMRNAITYVVKTGGV